MRLQEQNMGRGACSVEGDSWTRWLHATRSIEFEGLMDHVPLTAEAIALELGSGDGYQLDLLRERFSHVFAIDPELAPHHASGFAFAIAEALPFPDRRFDLIVSNCVLEHLGDRHRGLEEMVRILRPGGYMAHVVPSRFWKFASLLLNPLGYPLRVAEKWWMLRQGVPGKQKSVSHEAQSARRPGLLQVIGRWIWPPIHGTYDSHLSEFASYGRERWVEFFAHPQLVIEAHVPLVFGTQFGFLRFRFIHLRRWLARHGLSSSHAIVLRKR